MAKTIFAFCSGLNDLLVFIGFYGNRSVLGWCLNLGVRTRDWSSTAFPSAILSDYLQAQVDQHEWSVYVDLPYFDSQFVEELREKYKRSVHYSEDVQELVHGDFGNHNVLLQEGVVTGVLDWAKSYIGDAFFDVARVVLYCPRRDLSAKAALDFYSERSYANYRERIMAGVYFTMLINYGFAARVGNKESCRSSKRRIREIERVF